MAGEAHQFADVVRGRGDLVLHGVLHPLGGHHEGLRQHVADIGQRLAGGVQQTGQQPEAHKGQRKEDVK